MLLTVHSLTMCVVLAASAAPANHLAAQTGNSLPGVVGGSVTEVLAGLLLVSGLTTEVYKFASGMQVGAGQCPSAGCAVVCHEIDAGGCENECRFVGRTVHVWLQQGHLHLNDRT